MCPEELLLLITSIAIIIAKEQPAEVVGVYAAAFTTLGDLLATYLVQEEFIQDALKKLDGQ